MSMQLMLSGHPSEQQQPHAPSSLATDSASSLADDGQTTVSASGEESGEESYFSRTSVRRLQANFAQRCAELERKLAGLQKALAARIEARLAAEKRIAQAEARTVAAEDLGASFAARAVGAERLAIIEAQEAKATNAILAVLEPRAKALAAENASLRELAANSGLQRKLLARLFDGGGGGASEDDGIDEGVATPHLGDGVRATPVDPIKPGDQEPEQKRSQEQEQVQGREQEQEAARTPQDTQAEIRLLRERVAEVSARLDARRRERHAALQERKDALQATGRRQHMVSKAEAKADALSKARAEAKAMAMAMEAQEAKEKKEARDAAQAKALQVLSRQGPRG